MARAIMDYYNFPHSSGTFGAVGVAAGVGRIYGFDKELLNNALSIAEFNAPLVPAIRSVEYPSMNKDGVPFGVMTGALAVTSAMSGFKGGKNLLESDEYRYLLKDLGERFEVMELYFKPYTCCRWAHPAIDACLTLMRGYGITHRDIESVTIKTFHRATLLSKAVPKTSEEAQYNIAYPVASAIVYGDFGYEQAREESLGAPDVLDVMKRLSFTADDRFDVQFPEKRICQAEINTKDGRRLISEECQPRGEAYENIGLEWLIDKFNRINSPVLSAAGRSQVIKMICGDENLPVRTLIDELNTSQNWII
jgi:2-methylcitrate dehydratase PrpD